MKRTMRNWIGLALLGLWAPAMQAQQVPSAPAMQAQQVPSAAGQDPNATSYPHSNPAPVVAVDPPVPEPERRVWGRYDEEFSIEFGGRATTGTGNQALYGTYVGLYDGVRVFDQSLSLHAAHQDGVFFDDLSSTSYGYGGDPNTVSRLRVSKAKWYDLSGSFRRNKDFWDYNLLANPLNPTNSPLNQQILDSPHLLNQARKMTNIDLTVAPQSPVSVQLGYFHNSNTGNSYTTYHQGTEALLLQPWSDTGDTWHFGLSWKPITRTRLSYEQFYTHIKSSTYEILNSTPFVLSNGRPVTLGISYDVRNNIPCASPYTNATANPPVANAACSSYTGYGNSYPYRTDVPTEQFSFQSSYFKRLDVTGRVSYSSAESDVPFSQQLFSGLDSRVRTVVANITGKGVSQNITTSADLGVEYSITSKMRLNDQFRWNDFRVPGSASFLNNLLFAPNAATAPNTFASSTCPPPYTAATCPQHSSSSAADLSSTLVTNFLSQNLKTNLFEIEYDLHRTLVGRVGYRFTRRDIGVGGSSTVSGTYYPTLGTRGGCTTSTLMNGVCNKVNSSSDFTPYEINDHAAVFGLSWRTGFGLRLASDVELHSADNVYTAIMPRHAQEYKIRGSYAARPWLNFAANVRLHEMRNLAEGLGNRQHDRDYNFTAVIAKSQRFTADITYGHSDFLRDINICFVETPAPAFASAGTLCGAGYLTALNFYHDNDNYATVNFLVRPVQRAAFTVGYTVNATDGSALRLNPNLPLGPVTYQYHMPNVTFAYDINKKLTFKTGWNFYDYGEDSTSGPTLPRDFRTHVFTSSLRFTL